MVPRKKRTTNPVAVPVASGKPSSKVAQLEARTRAARERTREAKAHARSAKQQAHEARKLFKQAKKVAKRARDELHSLSTKLKRVLGGVADKIADGIADRSAGKQGKSARKLKQKKPGKSAATVAGQSVVKRQSIKRAAVVDQAKPSRTARKAAKSARTVRKSQRKRAVPAKDSDAMVAVSPSAVDSTDSPKS